MAQFEGKPGDRDPRGRESVSRSKEARGRLSDRAESKKKSIKTGGTIGGVLGGIVGGPIGAPIGKAFGQFLGGLDSDGRGSTRQGERGQEGGSKFVNGPGVLGGQFGGGGSGISGIVGAQTSAQDQAILEQRQQQELISGQLEPFRTAGTTALAQQQALLGFGGQEEQQAAFAAFGESPGQKFLRDRQERALLRNQAAIGGLGGGNVRTALQKQAVGFAAQDFDKQFNRLGKLSGQGLQATTSGGQFGSGAAANIANLRVGQGEARASGILAGQQKKAAETEAIAGILGMFSEDIGDIFSGFFDE